MYFTPLDVAAENGNKKTVEILLDHGASISGGDDTVNKIFFEQIISAKKNITVFLLLYLRIQHYT